MAMRLSRMVGSFHRRPSSPDGALTIPILRSVNPRFEWAEVAVPRGGVMSLLLFRERVEFECPSGGGTVVLFRALGLRRIDVEVVRGPCPLPSSTLARGTGSEIEIVRS